MRIIKSAPRAWFGGPKNKVSKRTIRNVNRQWLRRGYKWTGDRKTGIGGWLPSLDN